MDKKTDKKTDMEMDKKMDKKMDMEMDMEMDTEMDTEMDFIAKNHKNKTLFSFRGTYLVGWLYTTIPALCQFCKSDFVLLTN